MNSAGKQKYWHIQQKFDDTCFSVQIDLYFSTTSLLAAIFSSIAVWHALSIRSPSSRELKEKPSQPSRNFFEYTKPSLRWNFIAWYSACFPFSFH